MRQRLPSRCVFSCNDQFRLNDFCIILTCKAPGVAGENVSKSPMETQTRQAFPRCRLLIGYPTVSDVSYLPEALARRVY